MASDNTDNKSVPPEKAKEQKTADKPIDLGIVVPVLEQLIPRIEAEAKALGTFREKMSSALNFPKVTGEELRKTQEAVLLEYWKEFKLDLRTEFIGRKDIEREKLRMAVQEVEPATTPQKSFIEDLGHKSRDAEELVASLLEKYKKKTLDELNKKEASEIITALKGLKAGGFKQGGGYGGY